MLGSSVSLWVAVKRLAGGAFGVQANVLERAPFVFDRDNQSINQAFISGSKAHKHTHTHTHTHQLQTILSRCLFPLPLLHTLILCCPVSYPLIFRCRFFRLPYFPVAVSAVAVFFQLPCLSVAFLPLPFYLLPRLCVLADTPASSAKTDEPIEMLFGLNAAMY